MARLLSKVPRKEVSYCMYQLFADVLVCLCYSGSQNMRICECLVFRRRAAVSIKCSIILTQFVFIILSLCQRVL